MSQTLTRLFMKRAHVPEHEKLADRFYLITLQSPQFQGLQWQPGQKIQIGMGSAFVARTFTPMEWDQARGQTRLLGYAHGAGPGSDWLRSIDRGAECDVFGPRASLDLREVSGPIILFGDETSIGLGYALSRQEPCRIGQIVLEVNKVNTVAEVASVLASLDLPGVELFERAQEDAHLGEIERRLLALAGTTGSVVLTGKAPSIQRLRRALRNLGIPAGRLPAKPYWAPGKTGLD